jgi:hypothetical protein
VDPPIAVRSAAVRSAAVCLAFMAHLNIALILHISRSHFQKKKTRNFTMATESTRKEKEKASGDEKLSKKETAFFESKARGNDAVSAGQWAAAIEAYTEVFCMKRAIIS